MELPPYEALMKLLRDKRRSLDIKQKEVAMLAGVSPAQLSRMENGNAEAKYSTVFRVWETLDQAATAQRASAADLCTVDIDWVGTDQTGRHARRLMRDNAYSQVPVREGSDGRAVGSISSRILMEAPDIERPIRDLMDDPFVEVRPQTSRAAVVELLRGGNDAVLVRSAGTNDYTGIITPADVI